MWPKAALVSLWSHAFNSLDSPKTAAPASKHADAFAPALAPVPTILAEEVTHPLTVPSAAPCTVDIATHSFAFSYGAPYVGSYTPPPAKCGTSWSKIVLRFETTVSGRQFDRLGALWIGGAEVLHLTTAEPSGSPVTLWKVDKDITHLAPILSSPQSVVLAIDNIVDSTYTGIFNATVRADFYPANSYHRPPESVPNLLFPVSASNSTYGWLLLPKSGSATGIGATVPRLPTNAIRAEIEVFLSGHANDEFWYGNVPDAIADPNNGLYPGTTFKELQVFVNNRLVGLDWPYPTIYSGGFNPLLWRPIVSTGTFDLPAYSFDVTPFLSLFFDPKIPTNSISFNVSYSANHDWFVSGNLKVWTDGAPSYNGNFVGSLDKSQLAGTVPTFTINKNSTDGGVRVFTKAANSIAAAGRLRRRDGSWQFSSFDRRVNYYNNLLIADQGNKLIFDQKTQVSHASISTSARSADVTPDTFRVKSLTAKYPLYGNVTFVSDASGAYEFTTDIKQGLHRAEIDSRARTLGASERELLRLRNWDAIGGLRTTTDSQLAGSGFFGTIRPGIAGTRQHYKYASPGQCYERTVAAYNRTITSDRVSSAC
ncbi:hypothetical protein HK105_200819 [Polyrhizophydium stewartii]|uniref:Peptide N-acetyl-beta-D-glucosaminyl asparaginase amidase A N-terminal domain-containing protein n=1 Tax=Polyrhizophydium stewartii TaxID=2732419 RepID=A0ABR4NK60_9FUNG|nr:hypothetical protein HK105_006361 [Polyrhizophydium stewartii]